VVITRLGPACRAHETKLKQGSAPAPPAGAGNQAGQPVRGSLASSGLRQRPPPCASLRVRSRGQSRQPLCRLEELRLSALSQLNPQRELESGFTQRDLEPVCLLGQPVDGKRVRGSAAAAAFNLDSQDQIRATWWRRRSTNNAEGQSKHSRRDTAMGPPFPRR
jgi:hypothetical protein